MSKEDGYRTIPAFGTFSFSAAPPFVISPLVVVGDDEGNVLLYAATILAEMTNEIPQISKRPWVSNSSLGYIRVTRCLGAAEQNKSQFPSS